MSMGMGTIPPVVAVYVILTAIALAVTVLFSAVTGYESKDNGVRGLCNVTVIAFTLLFAFGIFILWTFHWGPRAQ